MGGIIELAPGHALSGEQWQRAVFLIGAISNVLLSCILQCISQKYFSIKCISQMHFRVSSGRGQSFLSLQSLQSLLYFSQLYFSAVISSNVFLRRISQNVFLNCRGRGHSFLSLQSLLYLLLSCSLLIVFLNSVHVFLNYISQLQQESALLLLPSLQSLSIS